jgi:hypothetical protein
MHGIPSLMLLLLCAALVCSCAQLPHGNTMRSKTKVLQTPVPVGGTFPDWVFDGSRCTAAAANRVACVVDI